MLSGARECSSSDGGIYVSFLSKVIAVLIIIYINLAARAFYDHISFMYNVNKYVRIYMNISRVLSPFFSITRTYQ